ncbi:MAG TPA: FKBP-type peptidyl-prolyl cis-trans isomerase [Telluria sp.]
MKFQFPLIAAFVAVLSLTACGGGGGSSSSPAAVESPAQLSKIDSVVGTGAEAVAGKTATVTYSGYLYSSTAAGNKGAKFDAGSFAFRLGLTPPAVVAGFEQGVTGMKVGGKRTILIPSSLGYGPAGYGSIPPNAGLVFDVELTQVQ